MENKIKLCTKDMAALFGVKENTVRKLKMAGTLEARANKAGYTIVSEEKIGRTVYYTLDSYNNGNDAANFQKAVYNTDNPDFKHYFVERTNSAKPGISTDTVIMSSQKLLADMMGVSRQCIGNWDKRLQELGIIADRGWYYIKRTKKPDGSYNYEFVEGFEYSMYQSKVKSLGMLETYEDLYRRGKIEKYVLEAEQKRNFVTRQDIEGIYYFKVKQYELFENEDLYKATMELLVYGKKGEAE